MDVDVNVDGSLSNSISTSTTTTTPSQASPFRLRLKPSALSNAAELFDNHSHSSNSNSNSACNSAHPSPNGTLTRSTSSSVLDAATPRSIKDYEYGLNDVVNVAPAAAAVNDGSPFFRGWDAKGGDATEASEAAREQDHDEDTFHGRDNDDADIDVFSATPARRYSHVTTNAQRELAASTTLLTPLYASATSPLFPAPANSASASSSNSASTATLPPLLTQGLLQADTSALSSSAIASTSSSTSPNDVVLSPLAPNASAPSAPRLATLVTPIMSPMQSPSVTSSTMFFRGMTPSPLAAITVEHEHEQQKQRGGDGDGGDSAPSTSSSIHTLLDRHGQLPFPGQQQQQHQQQHQFDEDITISSAMFSPTLRSESVDSISSVLNDCGGHDDTFTGSETLHELDAPPLQPLPFSPSYMRIPAHDASINKIYAQQEEEIGEDERPSPVPPPKHPSDPPLIPSLRRPDLLHLAGPSGAINPRPISPFSPEHALFPDAVQSSGGSYTMYVEDHNNNNFEHHRHHNEGQDLINFDSDSENGIDAVHDQYAAPYQQLDDLTIHDYFDRRDIMRDYASDSDGSGSGSSNGEAEEEDYSLHTLYTTLSTSQSPYVQRAWEGSKIVLLPPKHALPQSFISSAKQYDATSSLETPNDWETFTGIHALRQETGSPDLYLGYGQTSDGKRLHVKLDAGKGQVQVSFRSPQADPTTASRVASQTDYSEFGMTRVMPSAAASVENFSAAATSQPLSRAAFLETRSSSTSSSALPPHLLVSSPASSSESSGFPATPPLTPDVSATLPAKMPTLANTTGSTGSTPRLADAVAFPSMEQPQGFESTPLSPTRRLNIVHEKVIYRKRRVFNNNTSSSAPSTLPTPPTMSRAGSATGNASSLGGALTNTGSVNSVQQAAERLSRLSTPSMQSISSMASVATNNNNNSKDGKVIKKRDSKVRLRVPKWLGGRSGSKDNLTSSLNMPLSASMKITESAPSTPVVQLDNRQATIQEEIQLVIEKVRVIQVDSYIVEWPGEDMTLLVSPRNARKSFPLTSASSQKQSDQQSSITSNRMHRNSSQPVPPSSKFLDSTVRQRKSFQHASVSKAFGSEEGMSDSTHGITSAPMANRHDSNISRSSRVSRRSSSALKMRRSGLLSSSSASSREFSSDIAYLLDPPRFLEHFAGLFEQALKVIIRSSKDFAEGFRYIRGQEEQAVSRLQREVLDEVWQYFAHEDAIAGLRHHLMDIFENTTMAFAHDYVYTKTIKPMYANEQIEFGNLINLYRMHTVTLADFGISTGLYCEATFAPVVDILCELCGSGTSRQELWEKMPPQSYKRLVQLISQTTDSASTVIALLEAKTPLDTIAQLRKAIDELVKASSVSESGHEDAPSKLATDDLLPLLSWAIVKASAKTLPSLLFYAKMFRLSAHTQSDSDWTIVQFEAAMAFLSTDPLHLQKAGGSASPAITSQSVSPAQPTFMRTTSEDSMVLPTRSRRGSIQSLPPESARSASRSPSHQIHLASYHKRTLSSLPSTRMINFQASGRPSSMVSAVTTEEDEDNAEMGPPAPPRKDSAAGSHDDHDSQPLHGGGSKLPDQAVVRPLAIRPPRRPFHIPHDQPLPTNQPPTRIPLNRSQTTPVVPPGRPLSGMCSRTSAELHRAGSDASRRGSVDWWGALRYVSTNPTSPPVGSEGTTSSRPASPASPAIRNLGRHDSGRSSFDLDRSSSDMGWVEWGRKRLSSMTSSTSLVDSAEGGRSVAEQIAEKIAASAARTNSMTASDRGRRNSESAANMLRSPIQFEHQHDGSASQEKPPSNQSERTTNSRDLGTASSRPRSTMSLSSTSSMDTDASLTRTMGVTTKPLVPPRSQFRNSMGGPPSSYAAHSSNLSRSRRFKKELRSANLGPSMALPQLHLDTASASSTNLLSLSTSSASSGSYRQRPSSYMSDSSSLSAGSGQGFYSAYSLSHSTSRLGSTPFSPIQEVAPPLQSYSSSPEHILHTKVSASSSSPDRADDSVPPTPTNATASSTWPHASAVLSQTMR